MKPARGWVAQSVLVLCGALSCDAGALAAAQVYRLTPTHSFVHFAWNHAGLSTLRGRFDKVSGHIRFDRQARLGQGRVELRLDSVNTGRPALDAALRRALGATGATLAKVEIVALRFDGDRPGAALGRLSLGSIDLPIRLKTVHFNCYLNPLLLREVCGGEFETELDPSTLGLALDPAFDLHGPIRLQVQVEAIRQDPEQDEDADAAPSS